MKDASKDFIRLSCLAIASLCSTQAYGQADVTRLEVAEIASLVESTTPDDTPAAMIIGIPEEDMGAFCEAIVELDSESLPHDFDGIFTLLLALIDASEAYSFPVEIQDVTVWNESDCQTGESAPVVHRTQQGWGLPGADLRLPSGAPEPLV